MAFFVSILRSRRFWGLTSTAVVLYVMVFVVLGRIDMSWIMPDTNKLARIALDIWPRLPFFAVEKESTGDGGTNVIYYTVPTRQFTPQELRDMGVTNHVAQPAKPK